MASASTKQPARAGWLPEILQSTQGVPGMLSALFEGNPDMVIVTGAQGRILAANPAAIAGFGYSREELEGQLPGMLLPELVWERHEGHLRQLQEHQPVRIMGSATRLKARNARGEEFPVNAMLYSFASGDGQYTMAVCRRLDAALREANRAPLESEERWKRTAVELEERFARRTQQLESTVLELRHKNEEVEAFVYIVSHDLRAPRVNLMGFSRELERSCVSLKSLLESCPLPEAVSAAAFEILDADMPSSVHFISQSSLKFESLIDSLLSLSRHGRQIYQLVEVDVGEVAANAVATLQQAIAEAGAEVEVGLLPPVTADLTALGQVFSNLIGNCLKYRDPERSLKLEAGGEVEDGAVHYWVRDNGLGIPEASKARLFQVFQRFHPQRAQGEGMGLAIVHRIVERHGGKIWAESREGEGTTFHFCLPCSLERSDGGSNPKAIQGDPDDGTN